MTTLVSRVIVDKAVCTEGEGILLPMSPRTVFVEGSPIALVGDQVISHGDDKHAASLVATGLRTVLADGQSVVTVFQNTTCGGIVATGAKTVTASEFVSPADKSALDEAGMTTDVPAP